MYLHWLSVNLHTVILLGSLGSTGAFVKDDGSNADAASDLVVVKENLLYSTDCR